MFSTGIFNQGSLNSYPSQLNTIGDQLASYPPNQQQHWQQRIQDNNQQQFNQQHFNQQRQQLNQQTQQLNQQQFNQQEISQSAYTCSQAYSGSLPNDGMSLGYHTEDYSNSADNYSNQNTESLLSNTTSKWASLLIRYLEDKNDNNLNTDMFSSYYDEFSRETLLDILEALKIQLANRNSLQSNKRRLKALRSHMLVKFLEKINYAKKIATIYLKDKPAKDLLKDIHTLAKCHVENAIKASIFNMFILTKNVNENSNCAEVDSSLDSKIFENKQAIEKIHIFSQDEFLKIKREFTHMKTNFDELKKQNELVLEKLNIILNSNDTDDRDLKRKRASSASSTTTTNISTETIPTAAAETATGKILAQVSFASVVATAAQQSKASNIFANLNDKNIQAKVKQPSTSSAANTKLPTVNKTITSQVKHANLQNSKLNCIKVCENGISRIINSNNSRINSNLNQNKPKRKSLIIGSAISDVNALTAVSKPFYYYTGQWRVSSNITSVRNYVSTFAKVINVEELSTHIEHRRHKSYKLTIESYCNEEILNSSNWPGGIVVSRWHGPPKQKKAQQKEHSSNELASVNRNEKAPSFSVNNQNKHLINNQMCEVFHKDGSKKSFLSSLKDNANRQNQTDQLINENELYNNSIIIEEVEEDDQNSDALLDVNTQNLGAFNALVQNGIHQQQEQQQQQSQQQQNQNSAIGEGFDESS